MGEKTIKVILDANVYVSFFLTRGETIASVFALWKRGEFEVFVSTDIVAEAYRIFRYPKIQKRITSVDQKALTQMVEDLVERIYPQERTHVLRDPDDEKYLEAASACQADYLVTGDRDLLSLKNFGTTRIVSPKEFVDILKK